MHPPNCRDWVSKIENLIQQLFEKTKKDEADSEKKNKKEETSNGTDLCSFYSVSFVPFHKHLYAGGTVDKAFARNWKNRANHQSASFTAVNSASSKYGTVSGSSQLARSNTLSIFNDKSGLLPFSALS